MSDEAIFELEQMIGNLDNKIKKIADRQKKLLPFLQAEVQSIAEKLDLTIKDFEERLTKIAEYFTYRVNDLQNRIEQFEEILEAILHAAKKGKRR